MVMDEGSWASLLRSEALFVWGELGVNFSLRDSGVA